jgi:hypothetical protein
MTLRFLVTKQKMACKYCPEKFLCQCPPKCEKCYNAAKIYRNTIRVLHETRYTPIQPKGKILLHSVSNTPTIFAASTSSGFGGTSSGSGFNNGACTPPPPVAIATEPMICDQQPAPRNVLIRDDFPQTGLATNQERGSGFGVVIEGKVVASPPMIQECDNVPRKANHVRSHPLGQNDLRVVLDKKKTREDKFKFRQFKPKTEYFYCFRNMCYGSRCCCDQCFQLTK